MFSALAGPPARQVSILYRAPARALREALPSDLTAVEREGWVLLELACAAPIDLPLGGDVALIAWRVPVSRADGARGLWVLDRWSSARIGAGWPERWGVPRSAERPPRHSQWNETARGDLEVEVRSGPRRVCIRATPGPRTERSMFVSTRQAELFLAEGGRVLNPHPLSWLIDRQPLARGQVGLGPLIVHSLEVTAPNGIARRGELVLDCAFRVIDRRREGADATTRGRIRANSGGLTSPSPAMTSGQLR
ncbi:hypothetical protein [Engelhardtia mirabilis]